MLAAPSACTRALRLPERQIQPSQPVKTMVDSPVPPPPFKAQSSPSLDANGSTLSTTSVIV
jgi:hypothetical protein